MIASLMMYARPQLDGAHDRFWELIRQALAARSVPAPEHLSQEADEFAVWTHPALVLSQTCGMPYRSLLHDKVQLVGTPDYGLEGCPAGHYRSALVVHVDDPRRDLTSFRAAVFAYNSTGSQSGYAAAHSHLVGMGYWFENRLPTGQHLLSAQAVAQGKADIAAIDAVTWQLLEKYEPFAAQLRVLEWTTPTPGLPLITGPNTDPRIVFDAVAEAIGRLGEDDRRLLGLRGIVSIPKADYLAVPNPI